MLLRGRDDGHRAYGGINLWINLHVGDLDQSDPENHKGEIDTRLISNLSNTSLVDSLIMSHYKS